jgi:hypothetical protein
MEKNTSVRSDEELRGIMLEVARTQLAAVTAALKFWGGWVESANRYTEKISAELARVSESTDDSERFVGRLTDSSREYLREMTALPNLAVDHFVSEIEKISKTARKSTPKRTRKARAKA